MPFWHTAAYNWVTGALFAVGALLFMLGATFVLGEPYFAVPSGWTISITFFAGSIPFTMAGYLQHFQAANAGPFRMAGETVSRRRIALIGWQPDSPGWISTFTQFVGTLAFNVNTFNAINGPSGWLLQDLAIWLPGLVGSILFLVSGYLAYIETGHAHASFAPRELAWWIVAINLLGCIAFMVSGILAYVPRTPWPDWVATLGTANLWFGALCFFVGAVLLMRESRLAGAR
ncbi:MAG: hypothetical protein AcusKO_01520 [Acuticoccus sp.]